MSQKSNNEPDYFQTQICVEEKLKCDICGKYSIIKNANFPEGNGHNCTICKSLFCSNCSMHECACCGEYNLCIKCLSECLQCKSMCCSDCMNKCLKCNNVCCDDCKCTCNKQCTQ